MNIYLLIIILFLVAYFIHINCVHSSLITNIIDSCPFHAYSLFLSILGIFINFHTIDFLYIYRFQSISYIFINCSSFCAYSLIPVHFMHIFEFQSISCIFIDFMHIYKSQLFHAYSLISCIFINPSSLHAYSLIS